MYCVIKLIFIMLYFSSECLPRTKISVTISGTFQIFSTKFRLRIPEMNELSFPSKWFKWSSFRQVWVIKSKIPFTQFTKSTECSPKCIIQKSFITTHKSAFPCQFQDYRLCAKFIKSQKLGVRTWVWCGAYRL